MQHPETIKVKHPDGYMIINKSDFDKDKHQEYTYKDDTKPKKPKAKKDEIVSDK